MGAAKSAGRILDEVTQLERPADRSFAFIGRFGDLGQRAQ